MQTSHRDQEVKSMVPTICNIPMKRIIMASRH